ncbi:hypothetical protein H4R33_002522 [Dimargaris cristalligena]|uniref:Ribosomal protein S13 n=1 Tax=Dimargaris cristalligena TaxID=215637 RepID=A0A4P9ZXT5_9FUNG|nr:hypothetical protein H4R33_002522 [Dimargaris cristalligena]RKP37851.1 hypothetical protein BJ085DRAFT_33238 [Dimargaris cristalligena]|eukprot:RKP37851.1 hypothetical protein BJ085DRAFT_33238 [Dimargaris cristalligena]
MLHLLGVNLPDQKILSVALTYFYGIGPKTAEGICNRLCIHRQCKLQELSETQINELSEVLSKMTLEADLRRQIKDNIIRLRTMGTYRGRRHHLGLPVHGQNTRNNAKTARKLNPGILRRHYHVFPDRPFSSLASLFGGSRSI